MRASVRRRSWRVRLVAKDVKASALPQNNSTYFMLVTSTGNVEQRGR
jgi:hypothetical protein